MLRLAPVSKSLGTTVVQKGREQTKANQRKSQKPNDVEIIEKHIEKHVKQNEMRFIVILIFHGFAISFTVALRKPLTESRCCDNHQQVKNWVTNAAEEKHLICFTIMPRKPLYIVDGVQILR